MLELDKIVICIFFVDGGRGLKDVKSYMVRIVFWKFFDCIVLVFLKVFLGLVID